MYQIGNIKARYVPKRAILLLCRDTKFFGILHFQNNSFNARASHVGIYDVLNFIIWMHAQFLIAAISSLYIHVWCKHCTYLDQLTLTFRGCLDNICYYNTCILSQYQTFRHNEFAVNILFNFTIHINYTYSGTRALSALTNNYITI